MTVLYVAGTESGVGKTALTGALAFHAKKLGRRVALFKPFFSAQEAADVHHDCDAEFYTQMSDVPLPNGWPIHLASGNATAYSDIEERLLRTVDDLANGGTTVIVEGLDISESDQNSIEWSATIVEKLAADVLLSGRHGLSKARPSLDKISSVFGARLKGVVLNKIPPHSSLEIANRLVPAMYTDGYKLVAMIPEDRRMLSPTVGQVTSHLEADLIFEGDGTESLVEHVMVGGWFLDQGAYVFSRRKNKAVVVRGDRSDIQMAALATSTSCLVLTAGMRPIQYVTYHAEQSQTPMLVVPYSTSEAMERLGSVRQSASVHHLAKIAHYADMLSTSCNTESLLG
jgi:BioD-like phosphotransacetylase family protein